MSLFFAKKTDAVLSSRNLAFYKEKFHYLLNIYISCGILNNKIISIGRGRMKNVFSDVNAEEVTPEYLNGVYCELTICAVGLFGWLLFGAIKLSLKVAWGLTKIAAYALCIITFPLLVIIALAAV